MIRQVGGRLVVEIDDVAEIDRRRCDGLVLAKLPVGCVQIGKIDAAEDLAFAHRLRIVERGRDYFLEINVLDIEGLEHMGTACAQQQRDLRLVLSAIEPGLHCLGRGCHSTERQCGRKNLDENRFHFGVVGAAAFPREEKPVAKGSVPFA